MSEATTRKACEIIETATKLFGENGENWVKHTYKADDRFCMVGALVHAATPDTPHPSIVMQTHPNYTAFCKARQFVLQAINERRVKPSFDIEAFNDKPAVTFTGVKQRMDRALKLCIEAAKTAPSE